MHSPLPDSSALEAGIIEDDRPSRLSRVQDNVRHLLRTSVFGSVASSPTTPKHAQHHPVDHISALPSPLRYDPRPRRPAHEVHEVLPSPISPISTASSSTTSAHSLEDDAGGVSVPAAAHRQSIPPIAHQSAMFNSRAVAALNHPDLSDPSLPFFDQQKLQRRQQKGWKRSRHGKRRRSAKRAAGSQGLLCVLAAVLLGALVATYLALALTSSSSITTTFHILFILAILLATIVFAHTLIRVCLAAGQRSRPRALLVDVSRHGQPRGPHRHRHRHAHEPRHQHSRAQPVHSADAEPYVPPTPIPVHISSDEVQADPDVAHPSATADPETPSHDWDKDVHTVPNPPPAYGRWRGSVRANPDLLHWQAIPSPTVPDTPALPSPTYEEAMRAAAQNESPPSYVTRESPARQREVGLARAGVARVELVEPEMVQVRVGAGAGVGMAM